MKIAVVGAGAMGGLFAGLLKRAGNEVWLLEKNKERAARIRSGGLVLEQPGGPQHITFDGTTDCTADIGAADILFVFVKAYDTPQAIQGAAPVISEQTTVVTLQNGLGNVEAIHKWVPGPQIVAGTTAHGATLLADGRVRHAGTGQTVIGPVDDAGRARARTLAALLAAAGIATQLSDDINAVLWGKLLVNVGINPVTAIMRIRNGEILQIEELVAVMRRAVQEGVDVAEARGIRLPFSDPFEKVVQVCRDTSENISSMRQDVEAGRQTEITHINGAVVGSGAEAGVPTPVNRMLAALVEAIECAGPQAS